MVDEEFDLDIEPVVIESGTKDFKKDLYKKFGRDRFCSIRPWIEANKIVVDIGQFDPDSGKLKSASNAFLDIVKFGTYLRAVTNCVAMNIYRKDSRMQVETDEGVTFFGGGQIDGRPVSRIFKAQYWKTGDSFDPSAFMWKIGHFEGTEQGKGIIAPNFKAPLSVDSIKMTRIEIAEISYSIDMFLTGHVARNSDWYDV